MPRIHFNGRLGHGLCAYESALRHCRHRAWNSLIDVRDVIDRGVVDSGVFINDRGVVDIGYRCGADVGIADVDPVHIGRAHVVSRNIDFTRAQGKPPHIDSDADPSTNKSYQSGSVDRFNINGSGYPAPTSANADPAAVMEWRVAP